MISLHAQREATRRNERKRKALTFIDAYWDEYWTSPSYRQIGEEVGLSSPSSVKRLMEDLVTDGLLEERHTPSRHKSVLYRVRHAA